MTLPSAALQTNVTICTCFTASSSCLPSTRSLCASIKHFVTWCTHYSTDLCPLSLTMSCPPVFGFELVGVLMQCKWMCWSSLSEWLSLVSMYMMFYFVINLRVYFLCPLSFFNLKVKMYIALCCTGQCPKVNKFLIKLTWLELQSLSSVSSDRFTPVNIQKRNFLHQYFLEWCVLCLSILNRITLWKSYLAKRHLRIISRWI